MFDTQVVVVPSVVSGQGKATLWRPFAKRIAPPRDLKWSLQRIRLTLSYSADTAPTDPTTLVYTATHGIGGNSVKNGTFPCAGVWKNIISPESEIMWVGCVPPGQSSYDPQIPVIVSQSDFLIVAVSDAAYIANSPSLGRTFVVRFSLDIDVTQNRDE